MRIMLTLTLLLLSSCIQAPPAPFHCSDYDDPSLRLQCQSMVLGLYMQSQNAMYSRWNDAFHIEPVYPAAPLAPTPGGPVPRSTYCQNVGGSFLCQ